MSADGRDADTWEPGGESEPVAQAQPRNRPGLGTGYGEQRHSAVISVPFVRGSHDPDVTLTMRYNDADGVRDMAGLQGSFGHDQARVSTPEGSFVLSVVDERGRVLPGARVGGEHYAIGSAGTRYQLGVENHGGSRYEVVASVDGLDVMDGDDAGVHKRGYILEPFSSMTIEGWRTSERSVAAFRFSGMEDSYAEQRGKPRNIGVIGAAFFHEEGGAPWQELQRRHQARPFPSTR
jgi:hypothetical protein